MPIHQRRKAGIEKLANKLLEDMGALKPGFEIEKLVAKLGIQISNEDLDKSVSGYSVAKNGQKLIALNTSAAQTPERMRFTLAHELGHLLLHSFSDFNLKENERTFFRSDLSSSGTDIFEIEANYFAACLLMPRSLLIKEFHKRCERLLVDETDVTALAGLFMVSEQAMVIRMSTLGLLGI